jgi:glycogen synthase
MGEGALAPEGRFERACVTIVTGPVNYRMKVLMTADMIGGVWTYALELAQALQEYDVQVVLATMGRRLSAEQRRSAAAIPSLAVYESTYKLEWMHDPWASVEQAGRWLETLQGIVQPDVVHLNNYAHAALDWHCPVLVAAHSCVLSWWATVKGGDAPAEWDTYREVVHRGLSVADLVVAPTRAMLDALMRHHHVRPTARVIPNGRRLAIGPVEKEPLIFSAGRLWDEAKNIAALQEVAPRLRWPVYVAGELSSPDGESSGLSQIRSLGPLSPVQTAAWMARSRIYCLPARYEPFGLSVLEAGLAGCALVLGDIPSLREVWGDAAVYVDPSDTGALESALGRLIAEPSLREQLAGAARTRAHLYTPSRMAHAYVAAYRELIAQRVPVVAPMI